MNKEMCQFRIDSLMKKGVLTLAEEHILMQLKEILIQFKREDNIKKMETQDITKIGIGTKEKASLKPCKVTITGVEVQTKTKEGKEMKSALVHVLVKHPDKDESIKMNKVKYIRAEKVTVASLWANLDEDGLFEKNSALSELLRFLKVDSLDEMTGKEIEAVEESKESTYLCLKVY